MPRIKLGSVELGILEFLHKQKQKQYQEVLKSITGFIQEKNLKKNLKKEYIKPQLRSLKNKKLIEQKKILQLDSVRITEFGDNIYFAYTKIWKKPIIRVDVGKNFWNARFRNPKQFNIIRNSTDNTKWKLLIKIHEISNNIVNNSRVKMGRTESKKWFVQGIALPINLNREIIEPKAIQIFNEVEKYQKRLGMI